MERTHGTWGDRTRVFKNSTCLVTVLELEPNQRCSWHDHNTAYNQFFVVKGCLGVRTDKGYTTKLFPGQAFTVEPGVKHEFITYDPHTTMVEVAYVEYTEHDINRDRLGGATHDGKAPDNEG